MVTQDWRTWLLSAARWLFALDTLLAVSKEIKQKLFKGTYDAMFFDCDGVLVDSEPIVNRVLRQEVEHLGWQMTLEQCIDTFVGSSLEGVKTLVEQHIGQIIDDGWVERFIHRRDEELRSYLEPLPDASEMVAVAREVFRGRIACASNSERSKIELQLEKTGLLNQFDGALFSAVDVGCAKPSPAVYLSAAESLNPPSASFLVIEDSPSGIKAGKSAGGDVIGLASTVGKNALETAGADMVVSKLKEVSALLEPFS